MKHLIECVCILIYWLSITAGTAYIVFGLGNSGWWFALTVLFMGMVRTSEK